MSGSHYHSTHGGTIWFLIAFADTIDWDHQSWVHLSLVTRLSISLDHIDSLLCSSEVSDHCLRTTEASVTETVTIVTSSQHQTPRTVTAALMSAAWAVSVVCRQTTDFPRPLLAAAPTRHNLLQLLQTDNEFHQNTVKTAFTLQMLWRLNRGKISKNVISVKIG